MWDDLCSIETLFKAYKKASKSRRSRFDVAAFEYNLEENLFNLQKELQDRVYQHGQYHSFYIHDPKKRLISAADFRDRIVHHALVSVLEPIYEKLFLPNSYANRVGKGTHRAVKMCSSMMKRYRFYLFMDVRQFFPSVDHQILLDLLRKEINDENILELSQIILKSGEKVLNTQYDMNWFPNDDLFAKNRPRGLPIGNMSSQFWANVYLHGLDLFLVGSQAGEAWVRYVDDFIVFSNSKSDLHQIKSCTIRFLEKLRLVIHEGSAQPTPVSQGITFLGFRLFPGYKRLKRTKLINGWRKLSRSKRSFGEGYLPWKTFENQLKGWLNHVRYGNTWHLRNQILRNLGVHVWQGPLA